MKFVSLLSSGIDSPVATYLMSEKADLIIFVHADTYPFADEKENKNFYDIAKFMKKLLPCSVKIYLIDQGGNLEEYKKKCNSRFTCIFCKKMMLRAAEKIAEKEKADAIIMGDSLGQVASQTLQNIKVIDKAVRIPIIRPLIGFDKEEVIKIAKKIGTYDLSIQPSSGCSAVPNKPSTMAKYDQILDEEKKINIEELVDKTVKNARLISI